MKLKRLNNKVCRWLPYQVCVMWLIENPNYEMGKVNHTKWFQAFTIRSLKKMCSEEWSRCVRYRQRIRKDVASNSTVGLLGKLTSERLHSTLTKEECERLNS